jgi:hypothetical protein
MEKVVMKTKKLANSMEQIPLIRPAGQKARILWKLNIYYQVRNSSTRPPSKAK